MTPGLGVFGFCFQASWRGLPTPALRARSPLPAQVEALQVEAEEAKEAKEAEETPAEGWSRGVGVASV